MKKLILGFCLTTLALSACEKVEVGEIELPPSQEGNLSTPQLQITQIQNVYLKYQDRFEVKTAVLDFQPEGIISGSQSPLIPLSAKDSQMQSLGFTTNISLDGEEAQLIYNDKVMRFKVGDSSLFVNDEPGITMLDTPIYNNGTIYIPLLPVLDVLKLDYEIVGADLTIGGRYTDGTTIHQQQLESDDSSSR